MTRIAIVGAGFSGTLLALHLLRRCPASVEVTLIERRRNFGRGAAYGTGNPNHLLNVPAGRMSAFQDRPNHFLDWLNRQNDPAGPFGPGAFVPRRRFGGYIRAVLGEELRGAETGRRLDLVRAEVLGVSAPPGRAPVLHLDRDRRLSADMVVLAIGNFPPEAPRVADPAFYDSPRYQADPWAASATEGLDPEDPLLLIGTGLTMVDLVISLQDRGHRGPIHAVSRRGLLPLVHAPGPPPRRPSPDLPTRLSACMRAIRAEARQVMAAGGTWQSVIDDLRPVTRDLWRSLTPADRARFLRHLRPWWDIHRHRMSPAVMSRIAAARACGQLQIHAGRIRAYRPSPGGVDVCWQLRGACTTDHRLVARVINCAGTGADYDRIADPLVRALLAQGLVRPDPLRLGLDVTPSGAVLDAGGRISRRIFAVGPVTKATFWEMVAVPDIRRQCELTAAHLAMMV